MCINIYKISKTPLEDARHLLILLLLALMVRGKPVIARALVGTDIFEADGTFGKGLCTVRIRALPNVWAVRW